MKTTTLPKPRPRQRRGKSTPDKTSSFGRRLMTAFEQLVEAHRNGGEGLIIRQIQIADAGTYSPADVRALRDRLGMSVAIFAYVTGVSRAQVDHWERGRRVPSPTVRRLFDRFAADPAACAADLMKRREISPKEFFRAKQKTPGNRKLSA